MIALAHRVRAALGGELRPMFQIAWPVAMAELGWMGMGLVDTMMVGRVGAEAVGAVSIGSAVFYPVAIVGLGMLLGLDYAVAHAFGAGRLEDTRIALVHGIYLSVLLAIGLTAVLLAVMPHLPALGIRPDVARATVPYLRALSWSLAPLLLYAALRRYLQALGLVRAVMIALISANAINFVGNWLLVFGRFGLPALGAEGSGWATTVSRTYLFFFLLVVTLWHERRSAPGLGLPWRFSASRFIALLRLGVPSALQMVLEVGVFATATMLVGRLSTAQLAAHQIALGAAAFTFMVPLGISSAAAVRVGHAMGRIDLTAATRAGWAALVLGGSFMVLAAVAFVCVPRWIMDVFTTDQVVIDTGITLLGVAAAFQLFDGLQVVATGALRGGGDTRTPMVANFIGHWLIGLPLGYILCFRFGHGVLGVWIGLCAGLVSVAVALIAVWSWRTHVLAAEHAARNAA
jgi:MATE family multidrug resistance protein